MLGPSAAPMAVLCLLLCLAHLFQGAAAVVCNCFNGHVVHIDSCACACNAGYLEPTCTFGVNDIVPISFSLNMTAAAFSSELFTNAVSFAASATATFVTAKNVSKFNAVRASVSVPGYTVSRVLDSVELRDPWVAEYKVISAHVVTPSTADPADSFVQLDIVLYEVGSIIITVNSIIWIICGAVLVVVLVCVETNFSINSEEFVHPTALKHRRSSRRLLDGPKKVSANLNEHRRMAPPSTMSLPMQILDDFVDSDEDDGGSLSPTSKYSLGGKRSTNRSDSPRSRRVRSDRGRRGSQGS